MEFYCAEKKCPSSGTRPYAITVPQEACVDEHNCATMFCPHCNSRLIRKENSQ